MDTLLDKVMQLITTSLRGLSSPPFSDSSFAGSAESGKMQRLRQTITELLQTETQLGEQRERLHRVSQTIVAHERQAHELDAAIDNALLAGDEHRAMAGQQALNVVRQQLQTARIRRRRLAIEVERLQSEVDRLEVKLAIQGVERKTLDEMIQRVQSEPRRTQTDSRWRVVDPE